MLGVIAARLYAQSSCSPFLPPFPPLFAPSCSSFSFPINGNGGVRGYEKKRDWLDGNPSAGFDAILGPVRGYRAPKMYSTVAGMLEKDITFSFSAFLYSRPMQKDVFMSLMRKIAIA